MAKGVLEHFISDESRIPVSKLIVFSDIDGTILDWTNVNEEGVRQIEEEASKTLSAKQAKELSEGVKGIFELLYRHHQHMILEGDEEKYRILMKDIGDLQRKLNPIKRWSRECMLVLAARRIRMELGPHAIKKLADAYWKGVQKARPFRHAKEFFGMLHGKRVPVFLITSSDARLVWDDKENAFRYDPEYSRRLKLERMSVLEKEGIHYDGIFVADPTSKASREFWEDVILELKRKHGISLKEKRAIMIGDSISGDLEIPLSMDIVKFGVLLSNIESPVYDAKKSILKVNDLNLAKALLK